MLATAFNSDVPTTVEEKRDMVLSHGLALWDMVTSCSIKGSMDADIKDYTVADLSKVLSVAPIKKILLNGGKAYEIFAKNYPHMLVFAKKLPSTSSANVRYNQDLWLKELKLDS